MTTILLVDDEVLLREGVREMLELDGYTVIEAGNGSEALMAFATNKIDMVISDVVMPEVDGVDLVARLRAIWPDVPILSISGGSRVVSARFGLDSTLLVGANDSLTKPFTREQLNEKLTKLLRV